MKRNTVFAHLDNLNLARRDYLFAQRLLVDHSGKIEREVEILARAEALASANDENRSRMEQHFRALIDLEVEVWLEEDAEKRHQSEELLDSIDQVLARA